MDLPSYFFIPDVTGKFFGRASVLIYEYRYEYRYKYRYTNLISLSMLVKTNWSISRTQEPKWLLPRPTNTTSLQKSLKRMLMRRVLTRTIQFENNRNICIILSVRVVSGISVDF